MNTCDNCANKDSKYCELENRDKYGFCGNFCGDLISRSALKKALEETKDEYFGLYQAIKAVDNAPTVEPEITNDDLQAAMTESYHLGYELAETKFKRPQGEWIEEAVPVGLVGRGNGQYRCSNCQHGDVHAKTQEVPFCWYCGAKMDGGSDNDKD